MKDNVKEEVQGLIKFYGLYWICSNEDFINSINWSSVFYNRSVSEDFIREFKDQAKWPAISKCQHLSEVFIREFQNHLDWEYISIYQKLSEDFIREFQNNLDWYNISKFQKLSESFIREFQNKVAWNYISINQKLSESFIREFQNKVNIYAVSIHQHLSEDFRKEFGIRISPNCWLYQDIEFKRNYLLTYDKAKYKIEDDYVYAYKSTRLDGYSVFNFQYHYEVGKTYESHADYNINFENSFGLSAWTKENALDYHSNGKLFLVKIHINDIAAIVHEGKIRCTKLTIVEEVNKE